MLPTPSCSNPIKAFVIENYMPDPSVLNCFHTCTATPNLFRHYMEELYVKSKGLNQLNQT